MRTIISVIATNDPYLHGERTYTHSWESSFAFAHKFANNYSKAIGRKTILNADLNFPDVWYVTIGEKLSSPVLSSVVSPIDPGHKESTMINLFAENDPIIDPYLSRLFALFRIAHNQEYSTYLLAAVGTGERRIMVESLAKTEGEKWFIGNGNLIWDTVASNLESWLTRKNWDGDPIVTTFIIPRNPSDSTRVKVWIGLYHKGDGTLSYDAYVTYSDGTIDHNLDKDHNVNDLLARLHNSPRATLRYTTAASNPNNKVGMIAGWEFEVRVPRKMTRAERAVNNLAVFGASVGK
jgi:hypothetical protein